LPFIYTLLIVGFPQVGLEHILLYLFLNTIGLFSSSKPGAAPPGPGPTLPIKRQLFVARLAQARDLESNWSDLEIPAFHRPRSCRIFTPRGRWVSSDPRSLGQGMPAPTCSVSEQSARCLQSCRKTHLFYLFHSTMSFVQRIRSLRPVKARLRAF
jgi:hypothetical protein